MPGGSKIDSWTPKSTLGGAKIEPRSPGGSRSVPGASQERPRASQERPKNAQERLKSAPRASKSVPRAPKSAPRAPQERPRAPQERPRAPQEPLKSAQRRPREPSGHEFEASELGECAFRRRSVALLVRAARSERFSVKLRVARRSVDMREACKNLCFSLVFLRFL